MSKLSKKIIAVILSTLLLGSSMFAFASEEGVDNGWRSTNIVVESRTS
jgi:hypothetical protein